MSLFACNFPIYLLISVSMITQCQMVGIARKKNEKICINQRTDLFKSLDAP